MTFDLNELEERHLNSGVSVKHLYKQFQWVVDHSLLESASIIILYFHFHLVQLNKFQQPCMIFNELIFW